MCLKLEEEDDSSQQELDIFSRLFTQLFSIQRAQQVEYNFNHVVDKSFEALFGFIHVLPGAFSAYNMKALTPIKSTDANPLMEYFKSINEKLKTQRIEETTFNFLDFLMRFFLPNFVYRHFYPLNIFT